MIRAAFLAFGRGAVIVADDATDPPRILATLDFDATTADPEALLVALRSHGVVRLALSFAGVSRATGLPYPGDVLGAALGAHAVGAGIEVSWVTREARKAQGRAAKRYPCETATARDATAVLLADVAGPPSPLESPALSPEARAVAVDLAEALALAAPPAPRVEAPPAATPTVGKVRIGVDPGQARMGVVVTIGDVAPLFVLHRETVEVGAEVAYPRPVKRTNKRTGETRLITSRRVLPADAPGKLADHVLAVARAYGATDATVERVSNVFGTIAGQATGLLRAAEVGAVVADRLSSAGIAVERKGVSTARARVVGKADTGDAGVLAALASRLLNPGLLETADERDAAVLCLASAAPPKVARAAARPRSASVTRDRSGAAPRDRSREVAARAEASRKRVEAEREAAGCVCRIGGRHKRECPLFKPKEKGGDAPTT